MIGDDWDWKTLIWRETVVALIGIHGRLIGAERPEFLYGDLGQVYDWMVSSSPRISMKRAIYSLLGECNMDLNKHGLVYLYDIKHYFYSSVLWCKWWLQGFSIFFYARAIFTVRSPNYCMYLLGAGCTNPGYRCPLDDDFFQRMKKMVIFFRKIKPSNVVKNCNLVVFDCKEVDLNGIRASCYWCSFTSACMWLANFVRLTWCG